jgi:hypothetical protein
MMRLSGLRPLAGVGASGAGRAIAFRFLAGRL